VVMARVNGRMLSGQALRARGYARILSNMPTDKLLYMRGRGVRWIDELTWRVFPATTCFVKPEPAFYRLCLEKLGREGRPMFFWTIRW